MQRPLRYEINNWEQVTECLSNSSKSLSLRYMKIRDKNLNGEVIRVEHEKFGCLFSYLVKGSGKLLMKSPNGRYFEFSYDDILKELEKYGFYIKFAQPYNISGKQIELLMTLQSLNMDKIRFISVVPDFSMSLTSRVKLIAFRSDCLNERWLDNTYQCTDADFYKAITDGYALNLDGMFKRTEDNWDFLRDKVLGVKDILDSMNKEVFEC